MREEVEAAADLSEGTVGAVVVLVIVGLVAGSGTGGVEAVGSGVAVGAVRGSGRSR